MFICSLLFFFFKKKRAYVMRISDWSSDVCSSDLLVDVARGDELVPGPESGVGLFGGGLEQHHVAELRVEFGERTVCFFAPLLDSDPGTEPSHVALAVRQLGGGGDEAMQADRKSVVEGKSVSVRVELGGRRC